MTTAIPVRRDDVDEPTYPRRYLDHCTIVVAGEHETGGTWAGATDALRNGYGRVASWIGPGGGEGNSSLVRRGAFKLSEVSRLGGLLDASVVRAAAGVEPAGDQLSLKF